MESPEHSDIGSAAAEESAPPGGMIPGAQGESQEESRKSRPRSRPGALFDVLLCTDLLASLVILLVYVTCSAIGYPLPPLLNSARLLAGVQMVGGAVVVATVLVILRLRREPWRTLIGRGFSPLREAAVGLATVPVLFLATGAVGYFFRTFFPSLVTSQNVLLGMIRTPLDLIWFLIMGITVGGIKEEIQRAFALRWFEKHLGGIYYGLAVWTVYFGIGHFLQGFDNTVGAGVLGLLFGWTYIRRQNIVAPVVAHAAYDAIVVAYSFFALGSS